MRNDRGQNITCFACDGEGTIKGAAQRCTYCLGECAVAENTVRVIACHKPSTDPDCDDCRTAKYGHRAATYKVHFSETATWAWLCTSHTYAAITRTPYVNRISTNTRYEVACSVGNLPTEEWRAIATALGAAIDTLWVFGAATNDLRDSLRARIADCHARATATQVAPQLKHKQIGTASALLLLLTLLCSACFCEPSNPGGPDDPPTPPMITTCEDAGCPGTSANRLEAPICDEGGCVCAVTGTPMVCMPTCEAVGCEPGTEVCDDVRCACDARGITLTCTP